MKVYYPAIVVSAIVFWLFGWIWYDLLFKNAWLAATGISPQQMRSGGNGAGAYAMVVSLMTAYFLAYGLARILAWRASSPGAGTRRSGAARSSGYRWGC